MMPPDPTEPFYLDIDAADMTWRQAAPLIGGFALIAACTLLLLMVTP